MAHQLGDLAVIDDLNAQLVAGVQQRLDDRAAARLPFFIHRDVNALGEVAAGAEQRVGKSDAEAFQKFDVGRRVFGEGDQLVLPHIGAREAV